MVAAEEAAEPAELGAGARGNPGRDGGGLGCLARGGRHCLRQLAREPIRNHLHLRLDEHRKDLVENILMVDCFKLWWLVIMPMIEEDTLEPICSKVRV